MLTFLYSCRSDFWALGCIIYQMLAGKPPFKAPNEYLTFQKIINLEYTFPPDFPPHARDLIEKLLVCVGLPYRLGEVRSSRYRSAILQRALAQRRMALNISRLIHFSRPSTGPHCGRYQRQSFPQAWCRHHRRRMRQL